MSLYDYTFLDNSTSNNLHVLFENENAKMRKQAKQYEAQIEELYTQIGKLTAQYEWMKKKSGI